MRFRAVVPTFFGVVDHDFLILLVLKSFATTLCSLLAGLMSMAELSKWFFRSVVVEGCVRLNLSTSLAKA